MSRWVRCFKPWLLLCLLAGWSQSLFAYQPAVPAQLWMEVRNPTGSARQAEIVRSGVPLPRLLNVRNSSGLAVLDQNGQAVPASFHVLARWHAQRDNTAAPIQWLLVVFPASVAAQGSARFRLSVDGSVTNPAPATPLTLTAQPGGGWLVNTGAARFAVGADPTRSFDSIRDAGGTLLATGGPSGSRLDGGPEAVGFSTLRELRIERQDDFSAVIVLSGVSAHALAGGGAVAGERRYLFTAGSRSAGVRESLQWEGEFCGLGTLNCGNQLNARLLQQWRSRLQPELSGPLQLSVLAQQGGATASAAVGAGSEASLRQRRRVDRNAVQRYELSLPGQLLQTGTRADAGVLSLAGSNGVLGLALQHMDWYEPQALRLLADGALAIDLADEPVWLGSRQGLFAEYRIGAYAAGTSAATVQAELLPALNSPLQAMPEAAWIAASRATDELPVGTLPAALSRYDSLLEQVLDLTISLRRSKGIEGLNTFGLFPRSWGDPVNTDQIDCGADNDPTPGDDWDDPYWCATWTDYHNTSAIAVYSAWRSGKVERLHELAFPAALRMLYTQILRCSPDDPYFYCGMAPTGYGGYRTDFNSSHQYFDNLLLYYWLTGDESVWRTLQPAARTFRAFLCPARGSTPPGPVCAPNTPISDPFARVNDRVTTQFYSVFRFVGLAGPDASYLQDWESGSARWLTRNFVQGTRNGRSLGLIELSGCRNFSDPTTCEEVSDGPGTYFSTQLWMASLYDFNMLYRLDVDTNNLPLGQPAISPRSAVQAWSRTLWQTANQAPGNGTAAGIWPNELRFSYSGPRIGGSIDSLQPGWAPAGIPNPCADNCLYVFGKATLTGVLARSAEDLADPELRALALDLVVNTLDNMQASPLPLGKAVGEYFSRLHAAVARLQIDPAAPLFASGFE